MGVVNGNLPDGWTTIRVKDAGEVVTGTTPSKANPDFYGDEYPFYKPTDLDAGFFTRESRDGLSQQGIEKARLLPAKSVLVTCIGATIGKTGLIRAEGASNQQINAIIPDKDVIPEYLYYVCVSPFFQKEIQDNASATTLPILNKSKFEQLTFPLAPLPEQERIVAKIEELFTQLEAGTAALKRVQAGLKRYKASVLKAAVSGRLVNGNLEIGDDELPDGWQWAEVQSLAKSDSNAICAGPFGTIFKAKDFRPTGVPIIFLRHVSAGKYLTKKPTFMDIDKWNELFVPYSVFGGELLITKLGDPPGVCAIYPEGIGPAMVTPDVIKMSVNESAALPSYLMYYFNSEISRKISSDLAFGTTRLRLTIPIFRELKVLLPPLDEQRRIVAEVERRLSVAQEVETVVAASVARASRLRQSVLKSAFEGRLE